MNPNILLSKEIVRKQDAFFVKENMFSPDQQIQFSNEREMRINQVFTQIKDRKLLNTMSNDELFKLEEYTVNATNAGYFKISNDLEIAFEPSNLKRTISQNMQVKCNAAEGNELFYTKKVVKYANGDTMKPYFVPQSARTEYANGDPMKPYFVDPKVEANRLGFSAIYNEIIQDLKKGKELSSIVEKLEKNPSREFHKNTIALIENNKSINSIIGLAKLKQHGNDEVKGKTLNEMAI